MSGWALRMPIEFVASLGPLRLTPGLEICRDDARLWLRGAELGDRLALLLRELPGAERFEVLAHNELLAVGAAVPLGYLPQGPWSPLSTFLLPQIPPPQKLSSAAQRHPLQLVRDSALREPAAILTSLDLWCDYLETAPQARLSRLQFLADTKGRVFIIGKPLPALAGERFWETSGIYIAAGYSWSPAVDPGILRRALQLQASELAIWHADGQWDLALASDLVAARRGAGRATAEGLRYG